MTGPTACFCAVIFFAGAVRGLAADNLPAFEVTDIRESKHVADPAMSGGVLRGRYEVRTANMVELISAAYGVEAEKVQGGPSWLEIDRFDISAKAPANSRPETVKLMLRSLLEDRFKLKVHTDDRPMPVYALVSGKGKPKLKESDGSGGSRCQGQPQNPTPGTIPYTVISCQGRSMEQLARDLPLWTWGYFNDPVVDQTGIKGTWDFDLKWTARPQLGAAGADGISIFDAVEKQLGLKLELQKISRSVVAVDSVNQKPSPNPPNVAASLAPRAPAEFEVATVKPSMPGARQTRGRLEHGRLDVQNFPLKNLITMAWDIYADELLVGAPKFLDSAHFDITAKAPASLSGLELDIEDLRPMVQALLADRFNLKTHVEDRPVDAYVLTAVKPKLQKADPSNRAKCKEGPGPDGKDPRIAHPALNRLLTCQNITMAQFVNELLTWANGYSRVDALDATGLKDAYDFTLSFSTAGMLKGGLPGQPEADRANGETADPSGALSLPDAINRQLGLKLEMKKRSMPVLVIDHIDETPKEN